MEKGHLARACRSVNRYRRKIQNVTENENTAIGKETGETESSSYRIEKINKVVDKNKYLTTTVRINGKEKEFVLDTGSPISIMPAGNEILKKSDIQKTKHHYQDVSKNEVKIRRNLNLDIEYEKNKNGKRI